MFHALCSGMLALTCATTVSAFGTTHMVSVDGSMQYTSIQDAIAAAVNGDVIEVYPGTCFEKLKTNGKAIEITGQPGPMTGDMPVVMGTDEYGPILTCDHGETAAARISWLIFENGDAEWGGAVYIEMALQSLHEGFGSSMTHLGATVRRDE